MKKIIIALWAAVAVLTIPSCEKSPKDEEYGYEYIYMPKAYSTDGTNNYGITVSNYSTSDTSVIIGIYRSGMASPESVSVDLSFDTDTVAEAIAYANSGTTASQFATYKKCVALDASYFGDLPSKITIPEGNDYACIKLPVKASKMMGDPSAGDYKYAIGVRISNPTKYSLNNKLSFTMLIISKKFTK